MYSRYKATSPPVVTFSCGNANVRFLHEETSYGLHTITGFMFNYLPNMAWISNHFSTFLHLVPFLVMSKYFQEVRNSLRKAYNCISKFQQLIQENVHWALMIPTPCGHWRHSSMQNKVPTVMHLKF